MPSPSNPRPDSPRRSRWAWALGLAVTAALLVWVLRRVDARAVLEHVRHADPLWLTATVALATLTFPIRTVRWSLILRDAEGRRFPWTPLWHATAVGFMANNLLPARIGEVARAYVANRQLPVRFTTALASIGVERVFDGLVLLGLMAAAIATPSFPGRAELAGVSLSRLAAGTAAAFAAALLLAFAVAHRPAPWLRVLARAAPQRVMRVAEGLIEGLAVLKHPARFGAVVLWSVVQWLVNAAAFAACFRAFALPVPVECALLLQGVIAFGVAVPSSPSAVGVFEAATVLTLAVYSVDAGRAVAYALTFHLTTFVPIVLLGLYSQARVHVRLRELRGTDRAPEP